MKTSSGWIKRESRLRLSKQNNALHQHEGVISHYLKILAKSSLLKYVLYPVEVIVVLYIALDRESHALRSALEYVVDRMICKDERMTRRTVTAIQHQKSRWDEVKTNVLAEREARSLQRGHMMH